MYRLRGYRQPSGSWRNGLTSIVPILLMAALAVILWQAHSTKLLSVQSGSMAPVIQRGDAVIVGKTGFNQLRPGDVVSYHSPLDPSVTITHRLLAIQSETGIMLTKGDRLTEPDPEVNQSLLIGKVAYSVEYVGYVLSFLQSGLGLVLCVYIPALIVTLLEIRRLVTHFNGMHYRLAGRMTG